MAVWTFSAAADSTFDTLIYRSNCRVLHAVPAPRKDRGRNRLVGPAGQDDAEVAGGIADLTDRARDPQARVALRHFRLRGGPSNVPGHQDDSPARGRAPRDRPEDRAEAHEAVPGIFRRHPIDAGL